MNKIEVVLISHLHGDHFLGLFGFISSLNLLGRKKELTIFGPKGLREIITTQLKYSETVLQYPVAFHEVDPNVHQKIFTYRHLDIYSIPLSHRIDCSGFLFQEHPKLPRINKENLPEDYQKAWIKELKEGKDIYDEEGKLLYTNDFLTLTPKHNRSYAYCSDTKYIPALAEILKGVDLLYHETTFTHDMLERAEYTFHTTTKQAAELAKSAGIKKLLIGHFSSRYKEIQLFEDEAREVFPESYLGKEGSHWDIEE
jgi:ribonuclease Z